MKPVFPVVFHIVYSSRAYVLDVAKRSINHDIIVSINSLLTTDQRPMTDLSFRKFRTAISQRSVIRSTSCLLLGWGFRGR